MDRLRSLKRWTFSVFDLLYQLDLEYQLCFSGGKDSHALLGIYFEWECARSKQLKVQVGFSDTMLETASLYGLIDKIEQVCKEKKVPFARAQPILEKAFWVVYIGTGYPVPDFRNRSCTKELKIKPMKQMGGVKITGAHSGESVQRDIRQKNCGSSECGIDLLNKSIEPLAAWANCDVWDYLFLKGDRFLYPGVFDALQSVYAISEDTDGSLRMGCSICPVIALSTLRNNVEKGILPPVSLAVRELIEELRVSPRLRSPRFSSFEHSGALHIDGRRRFWDRLQTYVPDLLQYAWISQEIIAEVERRLAAKTYPPSYTDQWIEQEEARLSNIGQKQLAPF